MTIHFGHALAVQKGGECNSSFDVTRPENSGSYSTTYDTGYDNHAYEVMLWMNQHGTLKAISYVYDATGDPVPETKSERMGGNTWGIYRGHNEANEVSSFVRSESTNVGSIEITAISNWIKSRDWLADANQPLTCSDEAQMWL